MPAPIILNGIYTLDPGPSNLQDNKPASMYPWHIAWCSDRTPTAGYMLSNGIEWLLPTGPLLSITIGDTVTSNPGTDADVVDSGVMGDIVLDFSIPRGDEGDEGSPATIEIGSVTTGAPGSDVIIENVGTTSAVVLDITIPQGDQGDAATISIGKVTTGAAGSSATVKNVDSPSTAVLDFSIPKGDKGDAGNAATVSVGTVTTGAAGSSATVKNSGTSSAATLDFTIPKGDKGDAGSAATISVGKVDTGAAGSSATVKNSGTTSAATFDFSIPQGAAGLGTVTPSTPTRTLGSAFRPSTTKATLCIYAVKTQVTNPLLAGSSTSIVQMFSDSATTPTTERCRVAADSGVGVAVAVAITTANTSVLVYIVPAGHYVLLTASGTGTHTESIISQTEIALG